MSYFDDESNVEQYINMTDGYDGTEIVDFFRRHVPEGSKVLELGMGPGRDFDLLSRIYKMTGSDYSSVFVDRYRTGHPDADLLVMDAVLLETGRVFDAVYSNKVLIHLTEKELVRSLRRQAEILSPGGTAFHTFWTGTGEEKIEDLHFTYWQPDKFSEMIKTGLADKRGAEQPFEIVELVEYAEETENDSFYIVLKKK